MNIGIDARALIAKKVGFGYFLQNMLEAILEIDHDNIYFLFTDRGISFDISKYKNIKIVYYEDSLLLPKTFYYFFKLHSVIKSNNIQLDVFWGPMHILPVGLGRSVFKILTIHDFTHLKFPSSTTVYNLVVSKLFFKPSIMLSDAIVCISKSTLKDLIEYFKMNNSSKNILCVYEGGYYNKNSQNIKYNVENIHNNILSVNNERYVLFLGTIEPRKNLSILIKAAPLLKGKIKIVVCGKIGWEKRSIINKLHNTENLYYYDYINEDEKIFLMRNSFCQVQPSIYEGFGLPVVESMQAGSIVLVANNSSLREIVEPQELRFETHSVKDFCNKLLNLINDKELFKDMKEYCIERGKFFTWNKAAYSYIALFKNRKL